jgi:hypothetical protein
MIFKGNEKNMDWKEIKQGHTAVYGNRKNEISNEMVNDFQM